MSHLGQNLRYNKARDRSGHVLSSILFLGGIEDWTQRLILSYIPRPQSSTFFFVF